MLDKEAIYKQALALLKKDKQIIHDNLLYPQLGVSEQWWYSKMLQDEEKKKTIKGLMKSNAAVNTTKHLKKLSNQKDTAAMTAYLKINSKICRDALSTTRQENVDVPFDQVSKESLLTELEDLDE